jgi:hypothetical protein
MAVKKSTKKVVSKKATGKRRGPKPKSEEYYVGSVEFREELRKYYETEDFTKELATMIDKIATGLSFKSNFINYSYKQEMVGDARVKMFMAVKNKKFNLDSDFNPFSYFTTIAFHAFINRIKKEKKYHDTLNEYKERVYEQQMIESSDGMVYIKPNSDEHDYE